jgi:hypothetical protein
MTLVDNLTVLRARLLRIPRGLGVPQYLDVAVIGEEEPLVLPNAKLTKVSPMDISSLSSTLSVGNDSLWCVVSREFTLAQLAGESVRYWEVTGVEERTTKYRVGFIGTQSLLTWKILLLRFYEGR